MTKGKTEQRKEGNEEIIKENDDEVRDKKKERMEEDMTKWRKEGEQNKEKN